MMPPVLHDATSAAAATAWNVCIPEAADGSGRTPSAAKGGGEGRTYRLS